MYFLLRILSNLLLKHALNFELYCICIECDFVSLVVSFVFLAAVVIVNAVTGRASECDDKTHYESRFYSLKRSFLCYSQLLKIFSTVPSD